MLNMSYSPLAIKRARVLGSIYNHCEPVESIPVYLNDESGELLGQVDESLGHYADAFLFHLSEDVCKRLSTGHYDYSFDYDILDNQSDQKKHIRLKRVLLIGRTKATIVV